MKIDLSILKSNNALATYVIGVAVTFVTWLFTTVKTDAELKAETKYRYPYDSLRITIMELRLDCPTE